MKLLMLCMGIFLIFVTTAQGYDVVLKNGKSIHGTKISEDENLIVVQDTNGIRINIKKQNIDTAKTEAANQQATAVQTPQPAAPKTTPKTATPEKVTPKRPARKITKEDLDKLREKYDLGEGTFGEGSEQDSEIEDSEAESTVEKTEAEWRQEAEMHRQKLQQAQEQSNRLNEECEKLKQITVQTHVLVDEQGNELPMQDTVKQVCDLADSARAKVDEEQTSYSEFASEAKQSGAPPGWLRDAEGNDPPQQ